MCLCLFWLVDQGTGRYCVAMMIELLLKMRQGYRRGRFVQALSKDIRRNVLRVANYRQIWLYVVVRPSGAVVVKYPAKENAIWCGIQHEMVVLKRKERRSVDRHCGKDENETADGERTDGRTILIIWC